MLKDYDDNQVKGMVEQVQNFVRDQKELLITLTSFKKQLKAIVPIQEETNNYYKSFAGFLEKYEEAKDKAQATPDSLVHVRLLSGPRGNVLKEKMETMCTHQTNPIKHIANWVKGEVWSLEQLIAAKEKTDYMETLRQKTIKDIAETQDTINKLNAGKFTFGSLLKSDAEKKQQALAKAQLKVELEKDVDYYAALKKML